MHHSDVCGTESYFERTCFQVHVMFLSLLYGRPRNKHEKWTHFTKQLTFDLHLKTQREEFHIKKDERAWPVNFLAFKRHMTGVWWSWELSAKETGK